MTTPPAMTQPMMRVQRGCIVILGTLRERRVRHDRRLLLLAVRQGNEAEQPADRRQRRAEDVLRRVAEHPRQRSADRREEAERARIDCSGDHRQRGRDDKHDHRAGAPLRGVAPQRPERIGRVVQGECAERERQVRDRERAERVGSVDGWRRARGKRDWDQAQGRAAEHAIELQAPLAADEAADPEQHQRDRRDDDVGVHVLGMCDERAHPCEIPRRRGGGVLEVDDGEDRDGARARADAAELRIAQFRPLQCPRQGEGADDHGRNADE